jgi:hypothetical protein
MAFGGFLRQSTAVDILIGPFLDKEDGITPKTELTLDVELSKNGQALANKNDDTNPTYDAAGDVDGYYNCELNTTDTNTVGQLTVVAHHTDALPIRLDFQVVNANTYDSAFAATGAYEKVYTVLDDEEDPIDGVSVWVTTDIEGTNVIASGTTNVFGKVTFYLDAGTYYFWSQKAGYDFTNPDTEIVE